MADAWENLIANSSLTHGPGVDAWDHLLAQEGGGLVIGDGIMAEFEIAMIDAEVSFPVPLQASLEPVLGLTAAIDTDSLTAEVDVDELTGEICL